MLLIISLNENGCQYRLFWPPLILIAIGVLAVYYMAEQTQILPNVDRAELSTEEGGAGPLSSTH